MAHEKLASPPLVSDLLHLHASAVESVLSSISHLITGNEDVPIDELWVLRFVLSAPKHDVEHARKCAVEALLWRQANRQALDQAFRGTYPAQQVYRKFVHGCFCGELAGYHPLYVFRWGQSDYRGLVKALSLDEITEVCILEHEVMFRLTDQNTRRTGRLCKMVCVHDCAGVSMFKIERKGVQAMGRSSDKSSTYYPQLLGYGIGINVPSAFQAIMALARLFVSKSSLEKFGVCPAHVHEGSKSASKCPFVSSFENGIQAVPKFLGGAN